MRGRPGRCSKSAGATQGSQAFSRVSHNPWQAKAKRFKVASKADRFSLPGRSCAREAVDLGVEGLVLDLPTTPARGKLATDRQIGDDAVGDVAGRVDDLDVEPVDGERVLAVADRLSQPMGLEAAALFDYVRGVRVGPVVERDPGLATNRKWPPTAWTVSQTAGGIEIVARWIGFNRDGPLGGQPAPRRPALAILLLLPVLGNDELRYRPGMARGNQRGRHDHRRLAPRAVGAGDLPRRIRCRRARSEGGRAPEGATHHPYGSEAKSG